MSYPNDNGNYVRREKKPPAKILTPDQRFARLKALFENQPVLEGKSGMSLVDEIMKKHGRVNPYLSSSKGCTY